MSINVFGDMMLPGIDPIRSGFLIPAGVTAGSGAWLGYLDSIMGVCQPIDLLTQTFESGSKLPILLSEPAELAGLVRGR